MVENFIFFVILKTPDSFDSDPKNSELHFHSLTAVFWKFLQPHPKSSVSTLSPSLQSMKGMHRFCGTNFYHTISMKSIQNHCTAFLHCSAVQPLQKLEVEVSDTRHIYALSANLEITMVRMIERNHTQFLRTEFSATCIVYPKKLYFKHKNARGKTDIALVHVKLINEKKICVTNTDSRGRNDMKAGLLHRNVCRMPQTEHCKKKCSVLRL